jgi:hypothetical protein
MTKGVNKKMPPGIAKSITMPVTRITEQEFQERRRKQIKALLADS